MHKKFLKFLLILLVPILFVSIFSKVSAQTVTQFNNNLYWNISSSYSADVKMLQQFLTNQGLYTGPINGSYLTQTYNAVVAFQKANSIIPSSGYFGPSSRGKANEILKTKNATSLSGVEVDSQVSVSVGTSLQARVNSVYEQVRNLENSFKKWRDRKNSDKQPTPTSSIPVVNPPIIISTPANPIPTPPVVNTPSSSSPSSNEIKFTSYLTAYTYWDNTPPGSADISHPIIHQKAGGTGTFNDPITLAVGHSIINGKDILDYPAGTKFYVPNLRKYFIVEDTCGDGNTPQNGPCHNLSTADKGAQAWLDMWIDGRNATKSSSNSCAEALTANYLVIQNPASNYVVVNGSVMSGSSCPQQYGNTVITQ